jgi:lysozyme family protein
MPHPFSALAPEYTALLAAMRIDPGREHELAARAAQVLELARRHADEWAEVMAKTGVPRLWGLASFERESGSDYSRSPAQGDRWDKVSVDVPRGLGPYRCWGDACVAAYRLDRLDEVGGSTGAGTAGVSPAPSPPSPASGGGNAAVPAAAGGTPAVPGWTWPRACYEGELFNGFGPRAHGRHTGYLWAWTNIYTGGKYIADGKWDPDHIDEQCGMVPMMAALLRLDSSLALTDAPPWSVAPPGAGVPPAPTSPAIPGSSPETGGQEKGNAGATGQPKSPGDVGRPTPAVPVPPPQVLAIFDPKATAWLQAALNRLGAAVRLSKPEGFSRDLPLVVDGCYGRHTRRAVTAFQAAYGLAPDGLAGPLTLAEIRRQEAGVGTTPVPQSS